MLQVYVVNTACYHLPILLECQHIEQGKPKFAKAFKYENHWLSHDGCRATIGDVWSKVNATCLEDMVEKLNVCQKALTEWDRTTVVVLNVNIRKAKANLAAGLEQIGEGTGFEDVDMYRNELDGLLQEEETYGKQWSKVNWLKDGDKNSKFFHVVASARKQLNTIGYRSS